VFLYTQGLTQLVLVELGSQLTVTLSTGITTCFPARVTGITNWNILFAKPVLATKNIL
jgi:hypothetical protein